MMRFKRVAVVAGLAGFATLGFAVPSQASLTTFCEGAASGVTVPGNLVVRADGSCDLTDVVVQGNVTVRAGGNLLLEEATVTGNLVVQADGFANVIESTVEGNTRLNEAFGVYSEGSEHGGAVNATDPEFFYSLASVHGGNVNSTNGETFIESGWIARNVTTTGDLLTDLYDSVVERAVTVADSELGSVICESEVDGAVTFTGNSGVIQAGPGASVSDCELNVFGGDVTLTGNTAAATLSSNVIRGDLTCSDNSPAPVLSDNRVRGDVDCESGSAAQSRMSAKTVDVDARKAEVLAKVESRVSSGEEAAEEAGPAFE